MLMSMYLAYTGYKYAWLLMGGFLVSNAFFLIQFLPQANNVTLDTSGFHLRTLFRTHSYNWSDIKEVFIAPLAGDFVIAFDFNDSYEKQRGTRQLSKRLAGFEGCFPIIDSHPPQELLQLVSEFHLGRYDA